MHPADSRSATISNAQLALLLLSDAEDLITDKEKIAKVSEYISAAEVSFEKLPASERTLEVAAGIFYVKGKEEKKKKKKN